MVKSMRSYAQLNQSRQNLFGVISFCENAIDCRRKLQLQYFGEKFDPVNCHETCDNCRDAANAQVIKRDVTKYVQAVIRSVISDRCVYLQPPQVINLRSLSMLLSS